MISAKRTSQFCDLEQMLILASKNECNFENYKMRGGVILEIYNIRSILVANEQVIGNLRNKSFDFETCPMRGGF